VLFFLPPRRGGAEESKKIDWQPIDLLYLFFEIFAAFAVKKYFPRSSRLEDRRHDES